jgi:TIR domain
VSRKKGEALTEQRPPRVFISYSHDSEDHAARVLRLANDLRRDGIEAIIDQYVTSPPEGWPRWMDSHVRDDDYVVMVCTETYYRRVIGKETPGTGLGVRWEGNLIYRHLYKSGADLSRYVPVLTDGGSPGHIPEPAAGASYYFIDTPSDYERLLRRLFNRPAAEMPAVGEPPALPVLAPQWTARPPATLYVVPDLPPHFLPRPEVLGELKQELLAATGARRSACRGWVASASR